MITRKIFGCGTQNLLCAFAVIFAFAVALATTACDDGSTSSSGGTGDNPTPTAITYTAEQDGGVDGTTTSTGIVFTFSASVSGLTADNITVSGAAKKSSGALTGSGTSWTLPIDVNNAGLATVSISKSGIEAAQKSVLVYKAGQTAPQYWTITWNMNGGEKGAGAYPTQIVKGAVLATPYPDPTKANSTFGGWYSNSGLTAAYNFASAVTADLTLYAKWETGQTNPGVTITYTVTQNGGVDGGFDSTEMVFAFSASVASLTAADITVTGAASKGTGALTGSGTSWTLPITVTNAGIATVSISKSGIEAGTKSVIVYKAGTYAPGTAGLAYAFTDSTNTAYRVTGIGSATGGMIIIPNIYNGRPVVEIDDQAFRNSTSLTAVYILASLTSIGNEAFSGCTGLTEVTIASVTTIGSSAFTNCTSLTSITLPADVISLHRSTFGYCTSLASITVDENHPYWTSEGGILYNKAKTAIVAVPPGISGAVTLPASLTSIGQEFYDCTSLTEITIPAGVTSIGNQPFYGCSSLTSITVDANNPNYASEGGILYNKLKTEIVAVPQGISGTVTIPSGVTSINGYTFQYYTSLASIEIPASVTSIGEGAFSGCTSLTSVTFAGTIASASFSTSSSTFPGDLRAKFYATNSTSGTPGTYTRPSGSSDWTLQP